MALPVVPVVIPTPIAGQSNGRLDPDDLGTFSPPGGGPAVQLVKVAVRSGTALVARAREAGFRFRSVGSYRSYDEQVTLFTSRYSPDPISGQPTKVWRGQRWWLYPGAAPAAVPGTSNHGWGLAVDWAEERDGDTGAESISTAAVNWLIEHALEFGWSAELQSEPWHWRHHTGDRVTAAVLAYEEEEEVTPQEIQQAVTVAMSNLMHEAADRSTPTGRNYANWSYMVMRAALGLEGDGSPSLEDRLTAIETAIAALSAQTNAGFNEVMTGIENIPTAGELIDHTHVVNGQTGSATPVDN